MIVTREGERLIELSVLSVPGTENWVAEIWDLAPDGGELMHVHKSTTGEIHVAVLDEELDPAFIARWSRRAAEELRDYCPTRTGELRPPPGIIRHSGIS
ncbi:hypothetical protein [Nonomuraea sp. NPDC001699]